MIGSVQPVILKVSCHILGCQFSYKTSNWLKVVGGVKTCLTLMEKALICHYFIFYCDNAVKF